MSVALSTVSIPVPTCPANAAVMVVVPGATPVAIPALLDPLATVAIDAAEEVQLAAEVKSCVSPLANVPVALNPMLMPTGSVALAGVTWIEVNEPDSTTRLAVAVIVPECTVMLAVPPDCPVAIPPWLTVATWLLEVDQVTYGLRGSLEPSVKVPIALNWTADPGAIKALEGCNASALSVAGSMVSGTVPVAVAPFAENVALMLVFPALTPTAVPKLPSVDPTVAMFGLLESQPTLAVISAVEESSNTPVAVKCACPPIGIVAVDGVIEIETILPLVTVKVVEPTTEPTVAVTLAIPCATLKAAPVPAVMPKTEVFEDAQVPNWVMLRVLPSLNWPMAAKNTFTPGATLLSAGWIDMDSKFAALTERVVLTLTVSKEPEIVVVPTFLPVASPLTVIDATELAEELQVVTPVTS